MSGGPTVSAAGEKRRVKLNWVPVLLRLIILLWETNNCGDGHLGTCVVSHGAGGGL